MLLQVIGEHAEQAKAGTIVLRDLAEGDRELDDALRDSGYVKLSMPDSLVLNAVAPDDDEWLEGLSARSRVHQRREVLPWDDVFDVEILRQGGREPGDDELASSTAFIATCARRASRSTRLSCQALCCAKCSLTTAGS